ncbi:MAG TPA: hypothetical protein VI796_06725 [Candidatus Thermoplasmatota archaeon]|nr:hypothetical protein [Candidatus Thermoplasmatota archaeon]
MGDAAAIVEVRAVGAIGLIVRAATTRLVTKDEARSALDRLLTDSSMFITKALVERANAALPKGL